MSAKNTPPPGSMPSPFSSPDVQSMMSQTMGGQSGGQANQRAPRPIGTPVQEVKYLAQDVGEGVLSIIQGLFPQLQILPTDTPETQAKKQELTQRMQQWDQTRIQTAHQQYQQELSRRREQEEVDQQKTQQKAASKQELAIPSGKKDGAAAPIAGKSKKQSFMDDFTQKRKQLSSAG
jgi:hypothetical protein